MKKTRHFSALFIAVLLLLQPVGFYLHLLTHEFYEVSSVHDQNFETQSDAFCSLCATFLNQARDSHKVTFGISGKYSLNAASECPKDIADSEVTSRSSRGPPAS